MAKSKAKTDDEIKNLVQRELHQSLMYDREELSEYRAKALNYFLGDMREHVPAPKNRSKVVSKDVSDVIGWMIPGILRVFLGSDSMVEGVPVGPEDEQQAEQAGDYMNHQFLHDNDGYKVMHSVTWDALVLKNGLVKVWWDDSEDEEITEHSGLDDMQVTQLVSGDDVEVLAASQDPETGMYELKIKRTKSYGCIRYDSIEPENFGINQDADTIEEARCVWQREERTRSALIEQGFDKKKVDAIPKYHDMDWSSEDFARKHNYNEDDESADSSMDTIEVFEVYVRCDADGDGVAEMVKATYAGGRTTGTLLDWEIWSDDQPFVDIPCQPIPHRWDAVSIADETMDIQEIKTVLQRQMLDNTYKHNNPQPVVKEGSVSNPDALVGGKFGQPIFMKKNSDGIVNWTDTPYIADKALGTLSYADQVIERRTGVSRSTMALDPETLQNQTATAAQLQHDSAYSKIELVARNMAELGWKKVFQKALKLNIQHMDKPKVVRLRGKWVQVDPKSWNADMDVTINVGLGTGSRDRDAQMLQGVLMNQTQMLDRFTAVGLKSAALGLLPYVRKTMVKIAESAGIHNADSYYPPLGQQELQAMMQEMQQMEQAQQGEQGPDPKVQAMQQKMQMDAQVAQQKLQAQMQMHQVEHAGKMEVESAKLQQQQMREQAQMEADMQVAQFNAEINAAKDQEKLEYDYERLDADTADKIADNALNRDRLELDTEIALGKEEAERRKIALQAFQATQAPKETKQ